VGVQYLECYCSQLNRTAALIISMSIVNPCLNLRWEVTACGGTMNCLSDQCIKRRRRPITKIGHVSSPLYCDMQVVGWSWLGTLHAEDSRLQLSFLGGRCQRTKETVGGIQYLSGGWVRLLLCRLHSIDTDGREDNTALQSDVCDLFLRESRDGRALHFMVCSRSRSSDIEERPKH